MASCRKVFEKVVSQRFVVLRIQREAVLDRSEAAPDKFQGPDLKLETHLLNKKA